MKTSLLLLSSLFVLSSTAFAVNQDTSIGDVPQGEGKIFSNEISMVVRKEFGPDKPMKRHNHPGAQIVLTVIDGKGTFTLNDKEKHTLDDGGVLIFDGDNYISGEFPEKTLIVVTLIEKHLEHKH